jgi:hypothetical protein
MGYNENRSCEGGVFLSALQFIKLNTIQLLSEEIKCILQDPC